MSEYEHGVREPTLPVLLAYAQAVGGEQQVSVVEQVQVAVESGAVDEVEW